MADVDLMATMARLVARVPESTQERFEAERRASDAAYVPASPVDLVLYRLTELNTIAGDAIEDAAGKRDQLRAWDAWAMKMHATLAACPLGQPYSRERVDAVMADCPLKAV